MVDTSSSYFWQNRHSMYTEQDGYGGVHGWCTHYPCRYQHHTFMCYKYDIEHTSKQCNLDRLKSGLKRNTNETTICAVPAHAPQTKVLWWVAEEGTTKALVYTLLRGVGVGCLRVLMECLGWMWRVAPSLAATEARPSSTCRTGSL